MTPQNLSSISCSSAPQKCCKRNNIINNEFSRLNMQREILQHIPGSGNTLPFSGDIN